jgi:hypothetical protein
MGTRTTEELLKQTVAEEAGPMLARLGFVEEIVGAYWRDVGGIRHGVFFMPRSVTGFSVQVGASMSSLERERLDYVDFGGEHHSTLLVSRPLGLLRREPPRERTIYYFATVEEMRAVFPRVYADFVEQAEPWLATITTVSDVAREFYKWRVEPTLSGQPHVPDPFAWAIYGWLLQDIARHDEARPWLERALEELRRPAEATGRLIPRGSPAGRIAMSEGEARLAELLERDLAQ